LLALIPASIGLAYLIDRVTPLANRRLLLLGLLLVCLVEQLVTIPVYNKFSKRQSTDALARRVDRTAQAFYFSPNATPLPINQYHIDAMWAGLETGVPTINGYSGVSPPGLLPLYYSAITQESHVDMLRPALVRWAEKNNIDPSRIQWIGGPERWWPEPVSPSAR
jgi:hypothetical protein